jgi:hypothetical protein
MMNRHRLVRTAICWVGALAALLGLLAGPGGVGGQTEKQPPQALTPEELRLEKQAKELNKEGLRLHSEGEYTEAIHVLRRALDICRRLYPKERYPQGHPNLTTVINNLAF